MDPHLFRKRLKLVGRLAAVVVGTLIVAAPAWAGRGTFVVVEASASLPSAEIPNASGSIALPAALSTPPAVPQRLSVAELTALWQRAGAAYGIPWEILAAINDIESNFGQNMGPSSAGAVGWMQFMPSTWLRWGLDADADGVANPWMAEDAVFAAARYLAAAGGQTDLERALFAYNHADWYVRDVLQLAQTYGSGSFETAFPAAELTVDVEREQLTLARASAALADAIRAEQRLARAEAAALARAGNVRLLSASLLVRKQAVLIGVRRQRAADRVARLRVDVEAAEQALADARAGSLTTPLVAAGFGPGFESPLGYVFPVGGGPESVSVAHTHHDYPAADIAAPTGAPLYALTDGFVVRGWATPEGRCGIGFTMAAADGRQWTYCHLSYLEPSVMTGAPLTAGQPVGLVGSTGHSSGPHLHLQLAPATSYPQAESWFASFAGTAFSWQDAATPAPQRVFTVVEPAASGVVQFSTS